MIFNWRFICIVLKMITAEGAHPRILKALIESNFDQEEGYGKDCHTKSD